MNAGDQLGPYRIEAPIGAGGMGAVWKARDTRLDRVVAIKTIEGHFSERFEREAKTIASLNHPHICTLFDVGENYLVMEYIEGVPLKGPLPVAEVVRLGAQIAEALDAAHRKGITHRDLKPANVLVTKSGVKVIDFGLAKGGSPVRGEQDVTLTKPLTGEGTILGTIPYMSPEQLQGHEADARSDIFALGCVLYEMLTGRRAFEGKSQVSIMAAILEHEPAPLTEPVAPPWLDRIIRHCLRKNPDDRWQNARDIAIELRDPPAPAVTPSPAPRFGKLRTLAIALVCALIATSLTAWILTRREPSAPRLANHVFRMDVPPPNGMVFGPQASGSYAVSPDGQTLAVIAFDKEGVGHLFLRSLRDGKYRAVPGTDDARYPFWSPDNRWVAYRDGNALRKVSVNGGSPQSLGAVRAGTGGSWGAGGEIILTEETLRSRNAETGATGSDLGLGTAPWFLPDGRTFLYRSFPPGETGVMLGTIGSANRKSVLTLATSGLAYAPAGARSGHLLYSYQNQLYARPFDAERQALAGDAIPILSEAPNPGGISVSANGVLAIRLIGAIKRQIAWVDRDGKVLQRFGDPGEIRGPAVAQGGKLVAYVSGPVDNSDIWILDAERGIVSPLTTSAEGEDSPVWSSDGRFLAYVKGIDLVRRPLTGKEIVVASNKCAYLYAWLPNGRGFLCQNRGQLEHVSEEGAQVTPISSGGFRESHAQLAPGGHWISYTSSETGREEIYLRSLPATLGGPASEVKLRISTAGGCCARWRADGTELFYLTRGSQIMTVPLSGGTGAALRPGEAKPLFRLSAPRLEPNAIPYDVAPDGRRFIVADPLTDLGAFPISVFVNWQGLL